MDTIVPIQELRSVKSRFTLEGKKGFVTGAGGGIGRSTAAAMAEMGCDVALVDIRGDLAEENAEFIAKKYGVRALGLACDITDEGQVKDMFARLIREFGHIDCVHSNAGSIGRGEDTGDIDLAHWNQLIDINLTGMFLINQIAAQHMRDTGRGGSIVNTASISGHIINRTDGRHSVAYPAAKAGVLHLTKGFAADFCKWGVRVNSISPGNMLSGIHHWIPTPAVEAMQGECPMKRLGTMDELGGAVVFLMTDLASYITGADLLIDGGYCIW